MGLPGSKESPVHMGGGLKVENLDAFSLTIVALVLGLIRSDFNSVQWRRKMFLLTHSLLFSLIIAVAALIIALIALLKIPNPRIHSDILLRSQRINNDGNANHEIKTDWGRSDRKIYDSTNINSGWFFSSWNAAFPTMQEFLRIAILAFIILCLHRSRFSHAGFFYATTLYATYTKKYNLLQFRTLHICPSLASLVRRCRGCSLEAGCR